MMESIRGFGVPGKEERIPTSPLIKFFATRTGCICVSLVASRNDGPISFRGQQMSVTTEVVRANEKYILCIFLREGVGLQDAEDLVQETFAKAHAHLKTRVFRNDKESSMRSYLATVARTVLKDHRRRLARQRRSQLEFASNCTLTAGWALDEAEIDFEERLEQLRKRGGARLAKTVRLIARRRTFKEVAEILEISVRTVQRRMERAAEFASSLDLESESS